MGFRGVSTIMVPPSAASGSSTARTIALFGNGGFSFGAKWCRFRGPSPPTAIAAEGQAKEEIDLRSNGATEQRVDRLPKLVVEDIR